MHSHSKWHLKQEGKLQWREWYLPLCLHQELPQISRKALGSNGGKRLQFPSGRTNFTGKQIGQSCHLSSIRGTGHDRCWLGRMAWSHSQVGIARPVCHNNQKFALEGFVKFWLFTIFSSALISAGERNSVLMLSRVCPNSIEESLGGGEGPKRQDRVKVLALAWVHSLHCIWCSEYHQEWSLSADIGESSEPEEGGSREESSNNQVR